MTLRAPAWTRVKAARQEIEAWYVSRSILPPAISLDDDGTCIRLAEWRFNTPELREIDRIARKHGLELAVSGSSTRPHILVYDDPRPVFPGEPEVYDPHANIRAAREKFSSVAPVLEGISDDDPIHLAAREMWLAITKDLGNSRSGGDNTDVSP
jgi:hypothetical protein